MRFNKHSELIGEHAFMSASKYHWLGYDDEKMLTTYKNFLAAEHGTKLHELACSLIKEGIKVQGRKTTFGMYVNDAIGYKMLPEQILFYSYNCFGTADAISFRNNFLRIHDLKTGTITPASIKQLIIYASLFCLEYEIEPNTIDNELRIYQNNEIQKYSASPEEIRGCMDKIIRFDKLLTKVQEEELL